MPLISVTKCQATGNDFVLLDARDGSDAPYGELAKTLCHRRFSLGADGLLVVCASRDQDADAAVRIFNADGSEAETCGNGIRCVARYLLDENPSRDEVRLETPSGVMVAANRAWNDERDIRVNMGTPRFAASGQEPAGNLTWAGEKCPAFLVSMGNPHVVIFTQRSPATADIALIAAQLGAGQLGSHDTNLELAQVGENDISMRVYERGVGETWACGSGACAVAAAAIVSERARSPVTVRSKGGGVRVEWEGRAHPAYLTGDAHIVYRTEVEVPAGLLQTHS